MAISQQFLDDLRGRITLSSLIGRSIKVEKAGREHKACCPFHSEKTASFTINDDKGFYHCFGCGAHGDAMRWMTDHGGLGFMDGVKELAAMAGMELPAPSPHAAAREQERVGVGDLLAAASRFFAQQLGAAPAQLAALQARGVDAEAIARFDLGYAAPDRTVGRLGSTDDLLRVGLLAETQDGYRDRFRSRLMIPIHDARGRCVGFGARATREGQTNKFLNSPQSDHFDKGRLLYNHHRAAPAARQARRLVVVEGYFDVIALDAVGIPETVAPMGTALTEAQLERAWRLAHVPILLMDGDDAGRAAAMRAAERALPHVGPGRSLAVAFLPDGIDPDDLARQYGRDAVEDVIAGALPLADFLWLQALGARADSAQPEEVAGYWAQLSGWAQSIADEETRHQYLRDWRSRFDARWPPPPPGLRPSDMLPDGRMEMRLEAQDARTQARLRAMAYGWLVREAGRVDHGDAAARGRFIWGMGRRAAAGLLGDIVPFGRWPWVLREGEHGAADAKEYADAVKSWEAGERKGFDIGPMLTTLRCAGRPLTDLGNAERFFDRCGDRFRFTTAKGWLGWDGRRWKVLDQDKDSIPSEVLAAIYDTIRSIQDEARTVEATGMDAYGMDFYYFRGKRLCWHHDDVAAWGRTSEGAGKLQCIAGLAKRWVTVPIEQFDCDPYALNVMNGTLRFRRETVSGRKRAWVELEPHRRDDLNTRLAPVTYDPDALCPIYDDFIAWAQPDADDRRYLHQVVGYTLTGDTGEQKLWFHYGLGANGKSTAMDLWAYVAGDYSGTIGIETFLDQGIKKRGEQASPDLARLGGVRFLRASEPERGAKLNEALIKAATGGEPMAVRALHRGFFDLLPLFKLHIGGNYKPNIPGTDEGIWRRMKLFPWKQHRAENERDDKLGEKLRDEASGVLRVMIAGLLDWMENGLTESQSVQEATAAYREDSDPLARFLSMCVEKDDSSRVQASRLHEVFCAWCKVAGEREWSMKGLGSAMKDKGWTNKASNGMQWLGMRLIKDVGDFVDGEGRVRDDSMVAADAAMDAVAAAGAADADGDDYVPGF